MLLETRLLFVCSKPPSCISLSVWWHLQCYLCFLVQESHQRGWVLICLAGHCSECYSRNQSSHCNSPTSKPQQLAGKMMRSCTEWSESPWDLDSRQQAESRVWENAREGKETLNCQETGRFTLGLEVLVCSSEASTPRFPLICTRRQVFCSY